jgi:hypothetical protein
LVVSTKGCISLPHNDAAYQGDLESNHQDVKIPRRGRVL